MDRRLHAGLMLVGVISGLTLLPGFPDVSFCQAVETDMTFEVPSSPPNSAEEHLLLGIDFFLTDELEVAIDEFREAARQRHGYAEANHNLGVALAKTGDLTGALAAWTHVERLDSQTAPLPYHLSSLISYNYGISLLRDGQVEQAINQWEAALRIQDDFPEAHYAIGLGSLTAGNPAQAVLHFQEAIRHASNWPDAYEALGLAYYETHEYALAEQAWRQVLALESDVPKVHANLGLLRLQEGNYQGAIEHSRRALALKPDLVEAHFNLGVALFAKGDETASVKSLGKALSLNVRLTPARLLLGVVWSRRGNWAQAAAIWREAIREDPFAQERVWLHHNLGLAMSAIGNVGEAVEEFRVVAGQRPDWAPGWAQLGTALMATRQWEKAVDALETAARLQPLWAHLRFSIGKAHIEQGKLVQAINAFQRAVELDPHFIDAWFHLGVVFRTQNRSHEAVEPLRLAAEGGIREAQSLLASMYANGSGLDRNLPLAMLWWFRSSRVFNGSAVTLTAKDQLSQLRRALHGDLLSPTDRQEVLTGFNLIRQDLHRYAPFQRGSTQKIHEETNWNQVNSIEPLLPWVIEQALALDRSAQHQLHTWYTESEDARPDGMYGQIRDYFIQTAKEGNPFSCQVARTFATEASNLSISDWRLAVRMCPEQSMVPAF